MAVNPAVFLVGCPRSGTTLLRRLIDAHPEIAIINETHWIPEWFKQRKGLDSEGFATPELLSDLIDYRRFQNLEVDQKTLERSIRFDKPISYSSFVTVIFDLHGRVKGKRRVGDKTPAYVRKIPTLHALWPNAKFVHIIRDGRDVCLSVTNWKRASKFARLFKAWNEDAVTTAALWWEWNVRLGRQDGGSLGSGVYCEVRYEWLVSRPGEVCRELCQFLGVPYDDAMLRFHEGRERTEPNLDAKKAWRPVTQGLRDWRSQMSQQDVERFEAAAGDLLDELGYERAVPDPMAEALEHAATIREAFAQDLRRRGQRSPGPQSAPL